MSFRRIAGQVGTDGILKAVVAEYGLKAAELQRRQYGREARAVAALLLMREPGHTQREVARRLAMGTGSAVCRQIGRLKARLPADRDLVARLARMKGELERRT